MRRYEYNNKIVERQHRNHTPNNNTFNKKHTINNDFEILQFINNGIIKLQSLVRGAIARSTYRREIFYNLCAQRIQLFIRFYKNIVENRIFKESRDRDLREYERKEKQKKEREKKENEIRERNEKQNNIIREREKNYLAQVWKFINQLKLILKRKIFWKVIEGLTRKLNQKEDMEKSKYQIERATQKIYGFLNSFWSKIIQKSKRKFVDKLVKNDINLIHFLLQFIQVINKNIYNSKQWSFVSLKNNYLQTKLTTVIFIIYLSLY